MTQSIESIIEALQAYKDGQRITDVKGNEPDDVYELLRWLGYKWNVVAKKKVKLEAWLSPTGQLMWWLDTSKVRRAERERVAKVCEAQYPYSVHHTDQRAATNCAEAIRAME